MKESISLTWRKIPERYRLIGSVCKTCGTKYFPKRELCRKCRRKGRTEEIVFCGKGRIYSYTTVHAGPEGFEKQTPYVLAVVELEEGPRVVAQIVDTTDELKIGKEVEVVFRKIQQDDPEGLIHYGFKFRVTR